MSELSWGNGELASGHGLTGRRVLLPFEAELCETVGITKEEYFEFLAQAEETVVRSEEYDHIPDIRNEPVSLTTVAVQLAIGLALTAVSVLLTPKPKAGDDDPVVNIKRPDNIGPNRFTPTFGFNSIQELARLGQTVPLVFADQVEPTESYDEDGKVLRGGTRANSLLTYSMVSSLAAANACEHLPSPDSSTQKQET